MLKQGNTITLSTPGAATAYFRTEMLRNAVLVKKAGWNCNRFAGGYQTSLNNDEIH